jgi:hypothetical protein
MIQQGHPLILPVVACSGILKPDNTSNAYIIALCVIAVNGLAISRMTEVRSVGCDQILQLFDSTLKIFDDAELGF